MSEVKEMQVMDICNLDKIKKEDMALIIIDQQNEFYYAEDDDTTILCPGVQDMTPNIIKVKEWCRRYR